MMAQIRHPNPNRLVVIAGLGGVRNELVASLVGLPRHKSGACPNLGLTWHAAERDGQATAARLPVSGFVTS
jgi:hypothetical protein